MPQRREKSCALALCCCYMVAMILLSFAKNADIIGWMSFSVVTFVLSGYFMLGALMDRFLVYHMPSEDSVIVIDDDRHRPRDEGFDPEGRRRELINRVCPCMTYEDKGKEDICVVCLDTVQEGDQCRVLHCQHVFHKRCIDSWWLQRPFGMELKCPMCRQQHRRDFDFVPPRNVNTVHAPREHIRQYHHHRGFAQPRATETV